MDDRPACHGGKQRGGLFKNRQQQVVELRTSQGPRPIIKRDKNTVAQYQVSY